MTSLDGMTELPKKFEKYDMLEYLANSFSYNKEDYRVRMPTRPYKNHDRTMGYPVILNGKTTKKSTSVQAFFRGEGNMLTNN